MHISCVVKPQMIYIIFLTSRDELKRHIHDKKLNSLFIIFNFKYYRLIALNDVLNVCTLRHITVNLVLIRTLE